MTKQSAHPQSSTGLLEMIGAMILSGSLGYFVLESGQSAYNVVFFRCLFGALSLLLYCSLRGMLHRRIFNRKTLLMTVSGGIALVAN